MDEKITMQRDAFAIKACHMMGKTAAEASKVLAMEPEFVDIMYALIEDDLIDFDATIDD
jgi:hypothetical protein